MNYLNVVATTYNGTGEYTTVGTQYVVQYQKDINQIIHMLEKARSSSRAEYDMCITGPFNKDLTLPVRYNRVIN